MKLSDLANPHIRELAPYEPGRPIKEVERGLGIRGVVKLASNENPLGPSPKALAALLGSATSMHRYPESGCPGLRERLAQHLDVPSNQLVFGSGADEILELLAKTFLGPGDEVVMPWPSFAMYPIVAKGMGAVPVLLPLDDVMGQDLRSMAAAVTGRTKMLFVCNPNNPTGTSVGAAEFSEFVAVLPDRILLVIDEAYFEFVQRDDFPDAVALLEQRAATVVLRTFSKIYGLAGLRVGYGVAQAELIELLERARHPFNVNSLAEAAACAALDDTDHVHRTQQLNASGIEYLTRELTAMGYEVWPSDANFVFVHMGLGYCQALLEQGVIVRPMQGFGLDEHVRISVGLPEENEKLVKALEEIRRDGGPRGEAA